MTVPVSTAAFRLNELRKEVLNLTPDQNRTDLLGFLYQHAYNWASKQCGMAHDNADTYAIDYIEEFGEQWVTQVWAPRHDQAIAVLRPEFEEAA